MRDYYNNNWDSFIFKRENAQLLLSKCMSSCAAEGFQRGAD